MRARWIKAINELVPDKNVRRVAIRSALNIYSSRVLAGLLAHVKPQEVLELGTGFGLSTVITASWHDCRVVSVDRDAERQMYAKAVIDRFGLSDRVQLINATFQRVLSALEKPPDLVIWDGAHTADASAVVLNRLIAHVSVYGKPKWMFIDDPYYSPSVYSCLYETLSDRFLTERLLVLDFFHCWVVKTGVVVRPWFVKLLIL